MSYYAVVVNDILINDQKIMYDEIIDKLFLKNTWVFKTKNYIEKIKNGDKFVIYLSGPERKYFYGGFCIDGEITPTLVNQEDLFQNFKYECKINDIFLLKTPMFVNDIKLNLEFIKNKKNYGSHFQKGIAKITENDFLCIVNNSF